VSGAEALAKRLAEDRLEMLGAFAPDAADGLPDWVASVVLIGPAEPGFWPHLTAQPEWQDGAPDPVDRWSRRVIGRMACDLGGKAWFPFGGPPYHPFQRWALRTGRMWQSPVRLLVHAQQGLMVSFRGALALPATVVLPPVPQPCTGCAAPCLSACPTGALTEAGYDVPACHAFLDRAEGQPCLEGGCLVRRACPVSQGYARLAEQSAYHMRRFHPGGSSAR
jgi:ferredoxin